MKQTRKILTDTDVLTTTLNMLLMIVVLWIPTGQSMAAKDECAVGRICAWKDHTYRNCFDNDLTQPDSDWSRGAPRWDNCRWPGRMNDEVTSYFNNSKKWVIFYKHKNGGKPAHCVAPGASNKVLNKKRNDTFSSHTVFRDKPSANWCNTWDWW